MKRATPLILSTMLLSAAGEASFISGKVEVREKGNVKRGVVKDVLVYVEGL